MTVHVDLQDDRVVTAVHDDDDGSAARTRGLAAVLAVELADTARVLVEDVDGGLSVDIVPYRMGARPVSWADFGGEIILQVGDFGGRWELGSDGEDLAFLEDVVRSVVAGRVTEVFGVRRSRVVVVLGDGTEEVETGYDGPAGCLPIPRWAKWSRRVRYLPYES